MVPRNILKPLFELDDKELKLVLLSALYFFLVLCSYYILRPVREEMGVAAGVKNLPWLFMVTLLVMLIAAPLLGALVSRFRRRVFLPFAYHFFAANLLLFFFALTYLPASYDITVGRVFYVWISVFNLFIVSLFWGFMADGFGLEQSKRLFPMIAIGGTLGALLGATITQQLIGVFDKSQLIIISIIFLECAVLVVVMLDKRFDIRDDKKPEVIQSNRTRTSVLAWFEGIKDACTSPYLLAIAGYLFCYTLTSTFLYFEQAEIVSQFSSDRTERTKVFATIDQWVNGLTLFFQLFVSGHLIKRVGIAVILVAMPVLILSGFVALALVPSLTVLMAFQVLRRSTNYGLFKPARETLFTILETQQKYKAKSFIDTFVYRGGDALGASGYKLLQVFASGIGAVTVVIFFVSIFWGGLGWFLGKKQQSVARENNNIQHPMVGET
ncbi:NTP/NDP exchange transporter [Pleionea sp. CnH1-48]|uniref:NTP/NDP exchange transporter n=1 Tax=Pleionea sp. CnH1-48 TaxID=2954494 RepID=UPI00209852A1|nr:Npt1/Npt2 family nucleotide transporter [Pleionea sp. CnH1-48]MCO7223133.1 MFS transporter [Pleionea sp. CnH1-48]